MNEAYRPKTVMLVEDDWDIRQTIREILEAESYLVSCAANGQEALEELRRSVVLPDMILLDLMMPVMNGWQFRAEQRKEAAWAGIPVVALTAAGDAEVRARSIEPVDLVSKPVSLESLLAVVERHCRPRASD